jgi:DivIVA domain-containing protein
MPLTPDDVSNKRFTTVRLRESYDMTEVDQFLDEVEAELARLLQENADLRSGVRPDDGPATGAAAPAVRLEKPDAPAGPRPVEPDDEPAGRSADEPAGTPPIETLQVTTTAEASAAATRLLELAGRNADQLVGEAREEAERLVADARSTAGELTEEARDRVTTMESEARSRAEALDAETVRRREAVFGDIEAQKSRLDEEIERLRTFEREYRAELRTYFEEQLAALDGQGAGGVLGRSERDTADGEPPRLQELLDEQGGDQPGQ